MDLGKRLYELRKNKKLSQEEVAEKLNVTRQTVSKWETNQSMPDFDKIIPLCELYGISADELLKGEKVEKESTDEDVNENNDFDLNEAKNHLFTRGKDDKNDYENMTKNQIKQKSAEIVSSSILLIFVAIAFAGVGVAALNLNPVFVGCIFLVLIGIAVTRIVKYYMSVPKYEKTEEEKKEDKVLKQITSVVNSITLVIYLIVSFVTMAWHITWILFIIDGIICQIIKLAIILKGGKVDEE